jgi:glycosyltransferase involved in cell wall biosynthesis
VAARVQFAGLISAEALHDLLARAQLFVSASSYEAFGVATIEAMSSGTVPVVTPVGIHPDVVREGVTGFLYRLEDQAQAVACLRQALTLDEAQVRRIGQAARQEVQRYSWDTVVQSYLTMYQRVLQQNTRQT